MLAGVLIFAAVGYIVFAYDAGKSPAWVGLEVLGLVIYGSMAIRGVFGSPWWLEAGWVPCISWDLLTAAYIAWRIARGTHRAPLGERSELLTA